MSLDFNFKIILISLLKIMLPLGKSSMATPLDAGRIIGGKRAEDNAFPFVVSIQRHHQGNWTSICSGSIVTTRYVLTACHCLARTDWSPPKLKPAHTIRIVAGIKDWKKKDKNRMEVMAEELIIHPLCSVLWDHGTHFDTGLIKLESPLEFNSHIQPMKLISTNVKTSFNHLRKLQMEHAKCYTPGWGYTQVFPKPAKISQLKVAEGKLMTDQQCSRKQCVRGRCGTVSVGELQQICVKSLDGNFCKGDSGGPLVCNGHVYGVVSRGVKTCRPDGKQIYMDIQAILYLINTYVSGKLDAVNMTISQDFVTK